MSKFDLLIADLQALVVLLAVRLSSIAAGAVVALGLATGLGLAPGATFAVAATCLVLADRLGLQLCGLVEQPPAPAPLPRARLVRPVEAMARLGLPAVRTAAAA